MTSLVDQIKERLNIVDVISMYIPLTSAGKNYKAKSPFKQERTPSFYVSPDKGLYHCFSTGKGGDMFTFVQEMEGLDFKGALKVLAEKSGISIKNFNPKEKEEKDKLYEIMESATQIYESNIHKHEDVLDYVKARGVEEKTIKEWRIGYVPAGWRNLHDKLKEKYSDKDLATVGLIKQTEKGVYDTFRDRIMFPICDSSGRVIAFSGRIFKDDGKSGKYVNSPDTPLFNKSDVLFGIDKAKNYIRKYNFTTIVEGQFDVVLLHQAGFKNTVAVSGTALADSLISRENQVNNLGIVKRLSNNLVLGFDSDTAGINAARRSANIAIALGMDVKILDIEGGKDPADIIKEHGKDAWSKILREAKHMILFYTEKIKQNARDERELGRRIKEEVLPELSLIDSDIEKSYFIKKISEISQIPEKDILSDLEKIIKPHRVEKENLGMVKEIVTIDDLEKEIWGIYMTLNKSEDIKKKIINLSNENEFNILENKFKDRESEFIFGENDYLAGEKEKFNNFNKHHLDKKIIKIKEDIRFAEENGFEQDIQNLMKEQHLLEKEKDKINNELQVGK